MYFVTLLLFVVAYANANAISSECYCSELEERVEQLEKAMEGLVNDTRPNETEDVPATGNIFRNTLYIVI